MEVGVAGDSEDCSPCDCTNSEQIHVTGCEPGRLQQPPHGATARSAANLGRSSPHDRSRERLEAVSIGGE